MGGERQVVVIGLDGATFALIKPWAEEGKLPTFAGLLREGGYAPLRSVIHPYTAQAWSSMITGLNQGKHRILDFWERDFASYGFRLLNAGHRVGRSPWRILSESGKKVIVVNVPMTYPPEEVNGFLVAGRDTPGMDSQYTFPPNLKHELAQLAGEEYVIVPNDWLYSRRGRPDLARAELFREIRVRFAVVKHLMKNHPWDFVMFVVGATDGAAHFFWKYHDPSHPLYDPNDYSDTILEVYRRVDSEMAGILADLPAEATLMVVSDHGNGSGGELAVHLNLWLAEQGLLHFRQGRRSHRKLAKAMVAGALQRIKSALYSHLPFQTLTKLRGLFPDALRSRLGEETFFAGIDWPTTKAFSEEIRGNIWINLKGRDPAGIVGPGEYETIRDFVIERLPDLRDPTGAKVVRRVWRREELYEGPFVDRFPDLVVEAEVSDIFKARQGYKGKSPVRILSNEELKRLKTSGTHRMDGILMVKGSGVKAGVEIQGAQIIDVAPTVLYLLGEAIPREMDGRVLTELFEEGFLLANPPTFVEESPTPSLGVGEYSEEEGELVRERLEGLGYLG